MNFKYQVKKEGRETMEVNEGLLHSLIKEMENFPKDKDILTSGGIVRDIHRYGSYQEKGLEIKPEDMKLSIYYAGLAVLCRDMYEYLPMLPEEDATLFKEILSSVIAEDQELYSVAAFPYTNPDFPFKDLWSQLPEGMAASAAKGSPTIKQLGHRDIVHEWTLKPGMRLFHKFALKFKKTVCGKNGPYEQFKKGLIGKADMPQAIATAVISAGFSPATFWCPLAVYISILLIKTGLEMYCES
jgi:hypothetical protein